MFVSTVRHTLAGVWKKLSSSRLLRASAAGAGVLLLAGCVTNGSGKMGLDLGEVFAKDQQVFMVNGERAALRRYPNDSYDIKLYGPKKVIDLEVAGHAVWVANVSAVDGGTMLALDVPQADCAHVYQIYRITGSETKKWQTNYRSCDGPMAFAVVDGQWSARQTTAPRTGQRYMLVYQNGNLYTRPIAVAPAKRVPPKRAAQPKTPKAAPKPAAAPGTNLDDVAAPAAANLDDVRAPAASSANLDDIDVPAGKVDTSGLKADRANAVIMKDEK